MIDLKTLIQKTSVVPKLLQLKIYEKNNQKERGPRNFSPVFSEIIERFRLLLAGNKGVILEEQRKQFLEALHLRHRDQTKKLAENNIFWLSGMEMDIENESNTRTESKSSIRKLKYQLPSAEKIKFSVLTERRQQKRIDFSAELRNKNVTREGNIHVGNYWYSKWPVVKVCL